MFILLGILAGMALPIQTSINSRLREKVKTSYNASLISFGVAFVFLTLLLIITGQGIMIPFSSLSNEPFWIWLGGAFGVVFVTGNILLFSKLGSVQTVVLPILGQILMGLVVDHFGLFNSVKTPMTILRMVGAILVIAGVIIVSLAKKASVSKNSVTISAIDTAENKNLWGWRIFGVLAGMCSAVQAGMNSYLGKVIDSPLKAAMISFLVGTIVLAVICLIMKIKSSPQKVQEKQAKKYPWWIWIGGMLGACSIFLNVYLSRDIGVGMTVTLIVIGSTAGGILVDTFGLFGAEKKPLTIMKVVGVLIMIAGAASIKLF